MSSIEIIILCVTGTIACITYFVKHAKTSSCWSKEACFSCKMDKDNKSKSDVIIEDEKAVISHVDKKEELPLVISSVV